MRFRAARRRFPATFPNRHRFVYTPKHGSWLDLAEDLSAKPAQTLLREIRVSDEVERTERLLQRLTRLDFEPAIPIWSRGLDDLVIP
jgi:hypothetical protein